MLISSETQQNMNSDDPLLAITQARDIGGVYKQLWCSHPSVYERRHGFSEATYYSPQGWSFFFFQ